MANRSVLISGGMGGWYKKADSPYYTKRIKDLRMKDDKTKAKVLRLFEYIKRNKNMKVSLFHGTSVNIWENIKKSGHFTSPKIRNVADREARKKGLEEVFFTTFLGYSLYYATRSASQDNSSPIILHLEVPLIWIKEVADVILNTESLDEIYNEYNMPLKMKAIIEQPNADIDKIANDILDFFIETYFEDTDNEFTVKHSVPIRFVKQTTRGSKKFLEQAITHLMEHKSGRESEIETLVPEHFKNDPDIQKILNNRKSDDGEGSRNLYHKLSQIIPRFFYEEDKLSVYKRVIDVITDPQYHATKEQASKALIECFNEYDYNYGIENFIKLIPDLANGKPLRRLAEEFGITSFFTESIAKSIKDFSSNMQTAAEEKDIGSGYPSDYEEILKRLVTLKNNIYTVEQLGVSNKYALSLLENNIRKALRGTYLHGLYHRTINPQQAKEYYLNFSFSEKEFKGFSMPPLYQDKEAQEVYKKKIRDLYLAKISLVGQNIYTSKGVTEDIYSPDAVTEAIRSLQAAYGQPDIEQDEEAQSRYVDGSLQKITRRTRRSQYLSNNEAKILGDLSNNDASNLVERLQLPEWVGRNPKLKKRLIDAYRSYFSDSIKSQNRINKNEIHPFALQEDDGRAINYEKEILLEELSNPNLELDININYVKDDPELFALYKEKLQRILQQDTSINFLKYYVFAYIAFSGKRGITDPVLYQTAIQKLQSYVRKSDLRNTISDLNNKIYDLMRDEDYNIFHDPNLRETCINRLLQIDNMVSQKSPGLPGTYNSVMSSDYSSLLRDDPNTLQHLLNIEFHYYIEYLHKMSEKEFATFYSSMLVFMENFRGKNIDPVMNAAKDVILKILPFFCKGSLPSRIFEYIRSSLFQYFKSDKSFIDSVTECVNLSIEHYSKHDLDLSGLNYSMRNAIDNGGGDVFIQSIFSNPRFLDLYITFFCKKVGDILKNSQSTVNDYAYYLGQAFDTIPKIIKETVVSDPRVLPFEQKLHYYIAERAKLQQQQEAQWAAQQSQANPQTAFGWYNMIKLADERFDLTDVNQDKIYDTFKNTYEKSTGQAWTKDKFFRRAYNWRFYGDENGYITVREQNSGMLKLTGMAGNMKGIYRGMQDLLAETAPVWGMVTKNIASMAVKVGFVQADPKLVRDNIYSIPASVFGGAVIKGVLPDGGVQFEYSDVGPSVKYLIGNQAYFSQIMSMQG